MCGIAGVVTKSRPVSKILSLANEIQSYRGPDANGTWEGSCNRWQIGLAHQRLSILDLSAGGAQPMTSSDGNSFLVYNGEVYNYKELRTDLEQAGYGFNGHSDTEVVLKALQHWGLENALKKFNGMWALAWYDAVRSRLVLTRDRFGIKPLYYFIEGDTLFFSSEIKTILGMSNSRFNINTQKVGEFVKQSLLEIDHRTFFEGIKKILPGHFSVIDLSKNSTLTIQPHQFWSIPQEEVQEPESRDDLLFEEIRELFIDAVRIRLRSDVPVGVLLSGGLDSSAIAGGMHHILGSGDQITALSAVNSYKQFDESSHIDRMTRYLQCQSRTVELDLQPHVLMNMLGKVIWHNDEPIGGFSNVAHYLLMQEAQRTGITVLLSGQGADELLCGYKKFLGFYIGELLRGGHFVDASTLLWKFWRQGTILSQFEMKGAKRYLPAFLKPTELNIAGIRLQSDFCSVGMGLGSAVTLLQRQIQDVQRYSIPILTHYEDRMSMAMSSEIRLPFLDFRFVEKMLALPARLKINNGWTKYAFRRSMAKDLPFETVWRKDKMGFDTPESEWLRRELRPHVLKLFQEDCLMYQWELVDRVALINKYEQYCRESVNRGVISVKDIFNVISLETWLRTFEGSLK
jgi:asparagine synthase (glutamine-hydrolysing)